MNNKFNTLLLKLKTFFLNMKQLILTILIWQLILTLFTFSLANLIILFVTFILYLLNLFFFI